MNDSFETTWLEYVETPRRQGRPVKLDRILAERLQSFLRARQVKPYRRIW